MKKCKGLKYHQTTSVLVKISAIAKGGKKIETQNTLGELTKIDRASICW